MIDPLIALATSRPARVVRLLVERTDDELIVHLELRGDADPCGVHLCFEGVIQLRFLGEETDLGGLVLLQFRDMSADGWEGIRLRVEDYEGEFISFYCRDVRWLR
ncbi:MAG: hypothetical protein EOO70_09050 [Myxococcaceae bacterium]|nr:MAG: hypothetical protein EOO70_09050 [Myxococcaceae bacterium]